MSDKKTALAIEQLWRVSYRPPIERRERKQRVWRYVVMATSAEFAVRQCQNEEYGHDATAQDRSRWYVEAVGTNDDGELFRCFSVGLIYEDKA